MQRDIVENHLLKNPNSSLSRYDSFEVLPDKASDDEKIQRGELKMFTANTNSGKSHLVWDKESKNPRNSKKGSQSNLEEVKITQMRRSSETQ